MAKTYSGTIVESSLSDKNVLDQLQVIKKYPSGGWTLYDVLVNEEQIPQLAKSLANGPWYIHLWQPGQDEVKVIFKDKVFSIKYSDKSTWVGVVAYGKSIGIPDEQLDFPIN